MAFAESPGVADAAPFLYGTLAARPAFGNLNTYYWATDIVTLFRDTGTAWEVVGAQFYRHFVRSVIPGDWAGLNTCTADRVYLYPVEVLRTVTIDRIEWAAVATVAGSARVGVYADAGDGHATVIPDGGALLEEGGPRVIPAGETHRRHFVALDNVLQLTPDIYWLAIVFSDGTNTFRSADGFRVWIFGTGYPGGPVEPRRYALGAWGPLTDPCPATTLDSLACATLGHISSIP